MPHFGISAGHTCDFEDPERASQLIPYCWVVLRLPFSNDGMLVKRGICVPQHDETPRHHFFWSKLLRRWRPNTSGGILGTLSRTTTWATTKSCMTITITITVTITVTVAITVAYCCSYCYYSNCYCCYCGCSFSSDSDPSYYHYYHHSIVQASADRWCQCCTGKSLPKALENVEIFGKCLVAFNSKDYIKISTLP